MNGARIQLYAASTSGDGASATPLISSTVLSDTQGAFSITGDYTCPSYDSLVYLVATGGNPGLSIGTNNSALSEMAALGECGLLTPSTFINVNEVTTVASAFPLARFMSAYAALGSGASDVEDLSSAFNVVSQLVDVSTGTMPGPNIPTGYASPVAEINTLADILATCINSAGGRAGDNTPCGNLFSAVESPGNAAPTETIGAALLIAKNPTSNTSEIFNLATANSPFQPTLTSAPSSWALSEVPSTPVGLPMRASLLGEYLLNEGAGTIAHDTSGRGNDATITGPLWEGTQDLTFTAYSQEYVQVPTSLNATRSWQFAIYNPPNGGAQIPLAPGYGDITAFGVNPSLLCGTDTSHLCLDAGTPGRSSEFSAFNTDGTQAGVPLGVGWHIVSLLCGSSTGGVASKTHILYDGLEVQSYVFQGDANTCPNPTSGNYQVGGSDVYTGTVFTGKVAAFWAWSEPLTLADGAAAARAALGYIQSKGVITQFGNAMNPTPLLLAGIDSRTAGFLLTNGSADSWVNQMSLNVPFTRVNLGSNGQYAYDSCVQFSTVFGEQYPGHPSGPLVTVLWGGVNDIQFSNQNATQIAASLQCLAQTAKSYGSLVILATEISSYSGNSRGDSTKNALDQIIRANALTWGVDDIADLATNPMLGADGASANTTCFSDGLHPTNQCEPLVTAIMQNSVNEVLGSTEAAPHATSASSYQEMAGDRFLQLTGLSVQTVSLPSCIGYSLPRRVTNVGVTSAVLTTLNGEVLTGSSSVDVNASATLTPIPGDLATGGCSWRRTN